MKYLVIALACLALSCGVGSRTGLREVGSVYGFVSDEKGLPLESAQVEVAGEQDILTATNSAGYYMLADLAAGHYDLVITRPGYKPVSSKVGIEIGSKIEYNVTLEREVTVPGRISGMVINYLNHEPLVVEVQVMDRDLATVSDTAGKFGFDSLAPGYYLLKYTAFDFIDAFSEVTVFPGQTTDIVKSLLRNNTVISLYGINFEFGKAEIKKESYPVLDSAAGILCNYPEVEVEVQGHTDAVGSDQANLALSQKRAEAVRQYLIDVHMIEPVRLIAIGYGERKPVADNDTEAGRARNRRVDFVISQ